MSICWISLTWCSVQRSREFALKLAMSDLVCLSPDWRHTEVFCGIIQILYIFSRLLSYRLDPEQSWNTCRRHSSSVSSNGFPPHPRSAAGRRQSTECGTWLLKTPSSCYQNNGAETHHVFCKLWINRLNLAKQYILQVQPLYAIGTLTLS
jgi:hypothetical protein